MRDDDDKQTTSEDSATQLLTCETLSLAINPFWSIIIGSVKINAFLLMMREWG